MDNYAQEWGNNYSTPNNFQENSGQFAHKNAFEAEYFDAEDEDKREKLSEINEIYTS